MRQPRKVRRPGSKPAPVNPAALRSRVTVLLAGFTVLAISAVLLVGDGRAILNPGQQASAHSAIQECSSCHTATGTGRLSWVSSMFDRNPHADSQACLTCHKLQENLAFTPHSASLPMLNDSADRLRQVALTTSKPQSGKLANLAFPMDPIMSDRIYCATCHNDHQGLNFDMTRVSNQQCHSCHSVQFTSFEDDHPDFSDYPFSRRQRIKYDHAGHFTKHFPEIAKKNDPSKPIPDTCGSCHNSDADKRHMVVVPFDQKCATCHLDQITGEERVSGPKGIAFLSLPGLDVETLRSRGSPIGEWPEFSEAELSPFMAVVIGQNAEGQAILQAVEGLDLLDLTSASDEQIAAVTQLAWAIKGLFYTFLSGKASDVFADLNSALGNSVSDALIADLSANLPRDVIINAQLEWLPNLASEMLQRRAQLEQQGSGWSSAITETKLSATVPPPGQDLLQQGTGQSNAPLVAKKVEPEPVEPIRLAQATDDEDSWTIDVYGRLVKQSSRPGADVAPPDGAGVVADDAADSDVVESDNDVVENDSLDDPVVADADAEPLDTGDDVPVEDASFSDDGSVPAPTFSPIESDVDSEAWAEYGGWYRRDFAVLYRPSGHKDKFIYAWLNLTGPLARENNPIPPARVFETLTRDDAQGQCIKCHSVDTTASGQRVNWSPSSIRDKKIRFTKFVHEPHFGVMEDKGCLTCHQLEKGKDFMAGYESGDPKAVTSGFSPVGKELCQGCHTEGGSRNDCQNCHEYHVQDFVTPIIKTQIPN